MIWDAQDKCATLHNALWHLWPLFSFRCMPTTWLINYLNEKHWYQAGEPGQWCWSSIKNWAHGSVCCYVKRYLFPQAERPLCLRVALLSLALTYLPGTFLGNRDWIPNSSCNLLLRLPNQFGTLSTKALSTRAIPPNTKETWNSSGKIKRWWDKANLYLHLTISS